MCWYEVILYICVFTLVGQLSILAFFFFFFFKQKTAYEMRISDWSSDVCSSDLLDAPICQDAVGGIFRGRRGDFSRSWRPAALGQAPYADPRRRRCRSEERRVGKECVRCSSRWSPYH